MVVAREIDSGKLLLRDPFYYGREVATPSGYQPVYERIFDSMEFFICESVPDEKISGSWGKGKSLRTQPKEKHFPMTLDMATGS